MPVELVLLQHEQLRRGDEIALVVRVPDASIGRRAQARGAAQAVRERTALAIRSHAERPAIEAAVRAHDLAATRVDVTAMRQVEREVVSAILAAHRPVHVGVVVAVIRVRVVQRLVLVGDAVAIGVGDARELGLLAGHHHQALGVFGHHAQAVEQPFGEELPLALHEAPDAGITRGHHDGAVPGDAQAQRLEQLLAAEIVLRRVVVLDAVARRKLRLRGCFLERLALPCEARRRGSPGIGGHADLSTQCCAGLAGGQIPAVTDQGACTNYRPFEQSRVQRERLRGGEHTVDADGHLAARRDCRRDLDHVLADAIPEHRRRSLVLRIARIAQELRIRRGDLCELILLRVQSRFLRGLVGVLAFLEREVHGCTGGIQRREQILAVAEADLAAFVTQLEPASTAIGELAFHVEETALPDLHDGQHARIEAVVHAVGIPHMDRTCRRPRHGSALHSHAVVHQPLQAVLHRVIGFCGLEAREPDHRPAIAPGVERRQVIAQGFHLRITQQFPAERRHHR